MARGRVDTIARAPVPSSMFYFPQLRIDDRSTGLDSEGKAHGEHPPMVVRVEVRDGNLGAARH